MNDVTDLFLSLSPDKVLAAVEAAGLRCTPVCYPLNSFENRVYDIQLDDGSRVIAKFYRPSRWTAEQILEEHAFLEDLQEDEVPVCPVLPFPDGRTLHTIDHIHYCLFERKGGRAPDELTDPLVERLGMLAARIHIVGADRPLRHRIHLTADTYARENVEFLRRQGIVPPELMRRYGEAALRIAEAADAAMANASMQRIHGDFHAGNVIERSGLLHVLDFDDCVVGPPVQDLWLMLPGRDPDTFRKRELFIESYEQLRRFDRRTLKLVEPLRGLRLVHYAAWLARRWHDPIFPLTWPHFGTYTYWEDATRDLEEVARLLEVEEPTEDAPGREPAAEEDQELSNKDFFWDWEE
jgi:Ser/Thr protein kinase RdoA (MazF antagonist)